MAFPALLAAIVQVPAVTPVTVLPLTVQTPVVVEVNVTGLPDAPPVADTVPVPPTTTVGACPKVIVWLLTEMPMPMLKLWVAWGAAL